MNAKPILTIVRAAAIDKTTLRRLSRAGYCVVRVGSHDDIRAAAVIPFPVTPDDLLAAAGDAILTGGFNGPEKFGKLVAALLAGRKTRASP